MSDRNRRKGATWGYGLGLLGLLIVVGLGLWMSGALMTGTTGGANSPSPMQALNMARAATQSTVDRHNSEIDNALNAANSLNPASQPSGR